MPCDIYSNVLVRKDKVSAHLFDQCENDAENIDTNNLKSVSTVLRWGHYTIL